MKKILSLMLVLSLLLCAPVFAAAEDYAVKVSAPAGAPALALAVLAAESPENYTFVAADTIAAEFASAASDFIIAPLNAGAKLYRAGKSSYKLAAVVSWGNLYIASQRKDFRPEDIGETGITLFGENTINASVALYALKENGVTPASVEYLAGAANTQALLLSDAEAVVLTAEPALTAARFKNEGITAYAVNDLYRAATGFDGYTQAALFIREETAQQHPEAARDFIAKVQASCGMCETDVNAVAEAAVALEILPNAKVAMSAIPNCAIRFVAAPEAKEQVEATANIDIAQFGGAVPADDFYYAAE